MKVHFLLLILVLSGVTPAYAEPVPGVPDIEFTLADGTVAMGQLQRQDRAVSIASNVEGPVFSEYSIFYVAPGVGGGHYPISADEAREIQALSKQFANPESRYAVARSTDGYSAGTSNGLQLKASQDGGLVRYSDLPEANEKKLSKIYEGRNPLFASVHYSFEDAGRERNGRTGRMDPHGRIELSDDGVVTYSTYGKHIRVFEDLEPGKPALAGEFPSIEAALQAAREGNTAGLRFAADFGPQYDGAKMAGEKRGNQLMPLIPLGQVTKPFTKEKLIVALPPDQLQAYRRGEIPVENLLLIPPSALRYVPDVKHWGNVVDDYFELRGTGRDPARIFVANRRGGNGIEPAQTGTLNSLVIFGERDGGLNESLSNLRADVPRSILHLDLGSIRKPPSSGDCKFEDLKG